MTGGGARCRAPPLRVAHRAPRRAPRRFATHHPCPIATPGRNRSRAMPEMVRRPLRRVIPGGRSGSAPVPTRVLGASPASAATGSAGWRVPRGWDASQWICPRPDGRFFVPRCTRSLSVGFPLHFASRRNFFFFLFFFFFCHSKPTYCDNAVFVLQICCLPDNSCLMDRTLYDRCPKEMLLPPPAQ